MIISFSGIDSSGKSTQIDMLEKFLKDNGIKYTKKWGKIRGTPGILFLKRVFRADKNMTDQEKKDYRESIYKSNFKQRILLYLSLIDFIFYFGLYYRILNIFNKYLICDRYIWDSYVEVQTEFSNINLDKNILWFIAKLITPKPKYSLMFVIPAEVSLQRDIDKNDPTIDSREKKVKKISLYEKLIEMKKWKYVINGLKSKEDVHAEIKEILNIDYKSND